ncbi:MAG: oxidative damage protection protein [Gemmatimonadota bacterium]
MAVLTCTRCGRAAEGLPFPPYPDELGERVQRNVCAECWREYMGRQVMVINEYRLDLLEPRAQEILTQDMLEFLKLEDAPGDVPSGGSAGTAEEPA